MIQGVEHSLFEDRWQEKLEEQEGREEHKEQEERNEPSTDARVISIRALMKGLDTAFLPFALLKHDPFAAVQQYLAEYAQHADTEQMANWTEEERSLAELAHIRNAWNSLFRELRLDQLFFLCAWNSVPGASLNVVRATGLSFIIATPGPQARRWLVTRPVWRRDELVAWCEAIDVAAIPTDNMAEIILSERNMIRLKSSFMEQENSSKQL